MLPQNHLRSVNIRIVINLYFPRHWGGVGRSCSIPHEHIIISAYWQLVFFLLPTIQFSAKHWNKLCKYMSQQKHASHKTLFERTQHLHKLLHRKKSNFTLQLFVKVIVVNCSNCSKWEKFQSIFSLYFSKNTAEQNKMKVLYLQSTWYQSAFSLKGRLWYIFLQC